MVHLIINITNPFIYEPEKIINELKKIDINKNNDSINSIIKEEEYN